MITNSGHQIFGASGPGAQAESVTLGAMVPIFGGMDGTIHPGLIADAARRIEDGGLDGVWLADHLVHPLPLLESIITLEHVASVTQRVRVGTAVMLLALRSPVSVAKQLATIAHYHPGRLTIGVGVGGEHPTEFRASGIPMNQRGARLEEAARAVRDLWSGEPLGAGWRFNDLDGVRVAPAAPPIPLVFGGHTDKALKRAATLGEAWVGFYKDVDGFTHARDVLARERAEAGRSQPFPLAMVLPCVVGDSDAAAEKRIGDLMRGASTKDFQSSTSQFVAAGTPERIAERIAEYHAAGAGHFILALLEQGDVYLEQLARVSAEVLPLVRKLSPANGI